MEWARYPLAEIAPACLSTLRFPHDAEVWHLGLEHIESHTGRVTTKVRKPAAAAGNSTLIFDEGNVLYSKLRPYLNKVVVPDEPGIATTELIPLRPRPELVLREYLAYYLRSPRFLAYASQFVTGAKMPRVILDRFWAHAIPLPPLSEQRRIVEILDQADRLRRLRAEADAKADRILPALFIKMFGDPVTNPMGWKKQELGDLIKVKSGSFLPTKAMDPSGPFPVYGGNGINGRHNTYMFEKRTIILGRVGAYCGVVHYSEPRCWVTDNALYVAESSDQLTDRYLVEALCYANLNQYAGRAGQPLISGNRIYPVKILVPPIDLQQRFTELVDSHIKTTTSRNSSLGALERLFVILLHRAFSGSLTASWRQAHMKELLQEMEQQAKLLGSEAS